MYNWTAEDKDGCMHACHNFTQFLKHLCVKLRIVNTIHFIAIPFKWRLQFYLIFASPADYRVGTLKGGLVDSWKEWGAMPAFYSPLPDIQGSNIVSPALIRNHVWSLLCLSVSRWWSNMHRKKDNSQLCMYTCLFNALKEDIDKVTWNRWLR